MTKTMEEVEKFIDLRARGFSYEKISQELSISKPTLFKFERENEARLSEARAIELQAILEKHNVMRLDRAEAFSTLLSSALQEVQKRAGTLADLSTDKLLTLALTLESRLLKEAALCLYSPFEEALYRDGSTDIIID